MKRARDAIAKPDGETMQLISPAPGQFRIAVAIGDVVRPGSVLGELEVLGQRTALVAPAGAHGAVVAVAGDRVLARPAVPFGGLLVTLDPHAAGTVATAAAATTATAIAGPVFRAPTSGRFYGRPGPGKPAFVTAGSELAPNATICLLEVMKTFHRVTYHGDRARVREVLVEDGADVNAGDPLLALEAP
jgi:acetyl-CoA carboxylase biotin carboxyl carrier protein